MVNVSANGKYNYDKIIFDMTIDEWVQKAHKFNCKENGWKYNPLKKGMFGYDNLVLSLMKPLKKIKKNKNLLSEDKIDKISKFIHKGWCENYIYWRDFEPYKTGDYIKPSKKLNDNRRNNCAITKFKELPEDEKEKDRLFARFILIELSNKK